MSLPVQATLSENKWMWGGYSHKSANTLEHNLKKNKGFFSLLASHCWTITFFSVMSWKTSSVNLKVLIVWSQKKNIYEVLYFWKHGWNKGDKKAEICLQTAHTFHHTVGMWLKVREKAQLELEINFCDS